MPKKKATPAKKPAEKKKLRPDANEIAYRVMLEATGQKDKTVPPDQRTDDDKDAEAVERGSRGGKKGGRKGGKARAANLTPEQREEAAQVAAVARWKKKD